MASRCDPPLWLANYHRARYALDGSRTPPLPGTPVRVIVAESKNYPLEGREDEATADREISLQEESEVEEVEATVDQIDDHSDESDGSVDQCTCYVCSQIIRGHC